MRILSGFLEDLQRQSLRTLRDKCKSAEHPPSSCRTYCTSTQVCCRAGRAPGRALASRRVVAPPLLYRVQYENSCCFFVSPCTHSFNVIRVCRDGEGTVFSEKGALWLWLPFVRRTMLESVSALWRNFGTSDKCCPICCKKVRALLRSRLLPVFESCHIVLLNVLFTLRKPYHSSAADMRLYSHINP